MDLAAFEPLGGPVEERPRCQACGTLIDAPPQAETFRRRGVFAFVVQWRVCPCGAFARTQRVYRVAETQSSLPASAFARS